jgi:hypothetical protein
LPSPNFKYIFEWINPKYKYKIHEGMYEKSILCIINNPVEFAKFGPEILEIAMDIKIDFVIQSIFDRIFKLFESNLENYNYLPFISIKLPELCDYYYSNLVIKYILHTSILLSPLCLSIKNSTNTSLYMFSKEFYIKKSTINYFDYFKVLCSSFHKKLIHYFKIQETIPTISFIVPFPKMCKYQDNGYNPWNDLLHKSKSVLFCNIDSNHFYDWWNFDAVINFKWKTFGIYYYYLIWFHFTIFYLCFSLAILKQNNILYIFSILLGFMHLYFEFRQFLWKPKVYFNDLWNLFGK